MFTRTLLEKSRNELISQSKSGEREKGDGKTRYEKRVRSKVSSSNKTYNRMNMNQLFKDGILDVSIEIHGETDDYLVRISYGSFLDTLHDELKRNDDNLDLRVVTRALVVAFNKGDVYIRCSCPDFKYRFGYQATINKYIKGEPELIPADETNPHNKLGAACKHVLCVLANTSWIIKVASVIVNYIKYMEKHKQNLYARVMFPAIYGRKYEEPVQQSMFDTDDDTLGSEQNDIDVANQDATKRSRFQVGNTRGYRFAPKDNIDGQQSIDDLEEVPDEQ